MEENSKDWLQRAHQALIRNDFSTFVSRCFETAHAGQKYQHNWHIDEITHYLEACERGEIKRLIINIPPRHLKSLCVSVAWPAWLLGHSASRRVLVASYGKQLALKHSLDCRHAMESSWYKQIFPETAFSPDQNEKHKYVMTERGYRFAVSTQGAVTGEGGNFLIIDDPQNPLHIHKRDYRRKTIEWFEQVFFSRADRKGDACFVLVMQRLHEEDLTGHLLKKGGWELLSIPAICREDTHYHSHLFKQGTALHEERESLKILENIKSEMGQMTFEAQYQQNPLPEKGNIIRREWLCHYDNPPSSANIVISCDTASKISEASDYSALTVWAKGEDGYYLLEVFRQKLLFPELKKKVATLAEKWNPQAVLIEDKASGQALIQELKANSTLPIVSIKVDADKVQRLVMASSRFEAGLVKLPRHAPWLAEYLNELLSFPNTAHDDQVDATSQYLLWEQKRYHFRPTLRSF